VLRHLLVDGVSEVEVGYGFYEPYWGQGLATEVTQACVRFGLEILRLERLVGITSPGNLASQHVLTKCGLVYQRDTDVDGQVMALFQTRNEPAGGTDEPRTPTGPQRRRR
jgi:[ribosomal protein S5]-alanine N-acetyltransferase